MLTLLSVRSRKLCIPSESCAPTAWTTFRQFSARSSKPSSVSGVGLGLGLSGLGLVLVSDSLVLITSLILCSRSRGIYRLRRQPANTCHRHRQIVLCSTTSDSERPALYSTTCPADTNPCFGCQQGRLLLLRAGQCLRMVNGSSTGQAAVYPQRRRERQRQRTWRSCSSSSCSFIKKLSKCNLYMQRD